MAPEAAFQESVAPVPGEGQEAERPVGGGGTAVLKVAVTFLLASIVTIQLPVPEQAPDQPAKVEPEAGLAVKVTEVPEVYDSEQSEPQLMPAGLEVTVPEPKPDLVTVRV